MVLIIAEAGVNHNGSLSIAKELVDAAKHSGADIIKFQIFKAKDLVNQNTKKADYQIINTESNETQFEMLRKLELTFKEQEELKMYCDNKNIEFLASGFDLKSLEFIKNLDLKRYKIPSGEITNLPYLRFVGTQNKPIILSTGMANISEIKEALDILNISGAKSEEITLLHCTTEYPAPLKEINLRAMETMRKTFSIKVGYSDHSMGFEVSIAAVAMGASIIEKHLTLDRNLAGPDHKASLEPKEFCDLVKFIRNTSIALGSYEKKISNSELSNCMVVRKSIFAKKNIKKGELFSNDNLCTKRPGKGLSPMIWDQLIGKPSPKNFNVDDLISLN